ncbi:MAG: adenylate kinase [Muribaculaceae bacterium]|nr:adenylate kinase [Muribaculaceae bacterium]
MLNLIIFGAPGSGKGTQSEKLIDNYGLYHISTGEVLRDHIARGTDLGKIADTYISEGLLIPDDLMISILDDLLDKNSHLTQNGVIFDGFPRTVPQADALTKLLEKRNMKIDAVVGLEVDENELVDRILKRGKETNRADDNLETIKKRLEVYHNQTTPLREYYLGQGIYHPVKGSGSVEDIFTDIKSRLDNLK